MINACCNLYFCFIIIVHGDIRHLEKQPQAGDDQPTVHGDIRHLESSRSLMKVSVCVHGDIRHLEIK